MPTHLSDTVEDYLKVIYDLTFDQGRASTNQIAKRMGVTPASATGMIQRLATNQPPLLEYHKHRGVVLTSAGEKAALEVIRHHRLLELYLQEHLGYTWDTVHPEADRLEHAISTDLAERIAQLLGDPQQDPHGEPIPSRELRLPSLSTTRLNELHPGQGAHVERVRLTRPDLLRYLSEIGLVPQAHLVVLDYSPHDGNLRIQIQAQPEAITLGPRITEQIFVIAE